MSISFDRAADYYDETRGFPQGVEAHAGATIARAGGFSGSERVIEVGVGTGRIALPVAPSVHHYVGIDISTAMMQRLLHKRATEPVSVIHGDATRLPLPDNTFDAAVASHIFHLIPGWQQALAELGRVLKLTARLVHCSTRNDQAIDVEAILKAAFPHAGDDGRADAVGARGTNYLEESGWTKVSEETYTFTRQQKPADIIDQMKRRVWSRTWRMTDEQLALRIKALEQAVAQLYADMHKPVEVQSTFYAHAYTPPH